MNEQPKQEEIKNEENKEEEKKEEKKEAPVATWFDEKPKSWKVVFIFYDESHLEVGSIFGEPEIIPGTTKVLEYINPKVSPKVLQLFWKGFAAWASHEPMTPDMIFDDVNYLRKADGTIVFELESHDKDFNYDWNSKPVTAQIYEEKQCVVCKARPPNRILPCLHICLCEYCFPKTETCPICRKKKY